MIVKFDHITYIAAQKEKKLVLNKFRNGKQLFQEIGKENPKEKFRLMRKQQSFFDMYFFHEEALPVEVLFYDQVFFNNDLFVKFQRSTIYAQSSDLLACRKIFNLIGFKDLDINREYLKCNIKGIFDKRDFWLVVEKTENIELPYLDDHGYGCIAFLVNDLEKIIQAANIMEETEIFTEPEDMLVNGRNLQISFCRWKILNIIIEFIQPVRREK